MLVGSKLIVDVALILVTRRILWRNIAIVTEYLVHSKESPQKDRLLLLQFVGKLVLHRQRSKFEAMASALQPFQM